MERAFYEIKSKSKKRKCEADDRKKLIETTETIKLVVLPA